MVPPDVPAPPPEAARRADVFYLHPTGYFGTHFNQELSPSSAAADPASAAAAEHTDYWMLSTQASCFNESCRVWAPRYRQATFLALGDAEALQVAYSDCRRAFLHFLDHLPSPDAPFLLSSHSQGGIHLKRLIEELVEPDPALRSRLVIAYLVGSHLPTSVFGPRGSFRHIRECDAPDDTQCVAGWDTLADTRLLERVIGGQFQKGKGRQDLCTNPLTWRSPRLSEEGRRRVSGARDDGLYKGGVDVVLAGGRSPTWSEFLTKSPLGKEQVGVVGLVSSWPIPEERNDNSNTAVSGFWAQATNRGLFVPHISRDQLGPTKCVQKWLRGWYHCGDYALFWKNVRENVAVRLDAWQRRRSQSAAKGHHHCHNNNYNNDDNNNNNSTPASRL